jgi:NDP-sugar pyrophosphorylase family protein
MDSPQVVIPMSGVGQRFVDAGYHHLKPLIPVFRNRIIDEVMGMFPEVEDPLFIVAKNHKQSEELKEYLLNKWPKSIISEIDSHKFGPGHAILSSEAFIDRSRPVIVSYCDFAGNWNYTDFCNRLLDVDALILTYSGFHPHMLRNTKYAYVKKDNSDLVSDIQEKNSFTDNPMQEEASAGLYAFRSGTLLIDSLREQVSKGYSHKGEFYISLTILPLLEKKLKVKTFLMDKFGQFGTPEDLKDWLYNFKAANIAEKNQVNQEEVRSEYAIILAGGLGSRLSEITETPKPFVEINRIPLWKFSLWAALKAENRHIILRDKYVKYLEVTEGEKLIVDVLKSNTQGQADTAIKALNSVNDLKLPVTFLSCDNLIQPNDYENAVKALTRSDIIVWVASTYPLAELKPDRYSWVDKDNNYVKKFSLKHLPGDFKNPSMVIGNFTFKSGALAQKLLEECIQSAERYSSEVYIDSVIQLALEYGVDVGYVEIENFFAIGTSDELKTFNYFSEFKTLSIN